MEKDIRQFRTALLLSVGPSTVRPMIIELNRELRDHSFLPEDISPIPALYDTEEVSAGEKVIFLHYYIPNSMNAFDWWVAEIRPEENLAFGYVCLNGDVLNSEWGYINLEELENLLIARTLPPVVVVRDVDFKPQPWHEVRTKWERER